jgi:glycosyltransferase involved in cell wall biosynthesis
MYPRYPSSVLISGGREIGGVTSFAEALRGGFSSLGITAEVVAPADILRRWHDLRDPEVLKILSTTAAFAAPFARRAICVAHGFPRADMQGWIKTAGILASYKLANWNCRLAAVSHYSAAHLRGLFKIRVDAVIHNPLKELFLEVSGQEALERDTIAFAGRLHVSKGLDAIVPAIRAVLAENPHLRAAIIGDGGLRPALEAAAGGDPRIEFTGSLPQDELRHWLRRTRVFVSGCETEALGIGYLEALSQGCAVVMPACGGGLEIAPELIGRTIHLYSGTGSEAVTRALRTALAAVPAPVSLSAYSPRVIAQAYLAVDCSREAQAAELAGAIL